MAAPIADVDLQAVMDIRKNPSILQRYGKKIDETYVSNVNALLVDYFTDADAKEGSFNDFLRRKTEAEKDRGSKQMTSFIRDLKEDINRQTESGSWGSVPYIESGGALMYGGGDRDGGRFTVSKALLGQKQLKNFVSDPDTLKLWRYAILDPHHKSVLDSLELNPDMRKTAHMAPSHELREMFFEKLEASQQQQLQFMLMRLTMLNKNYDFFSNPDILNKQQYDESKEPDQAKFIGENLWNSAGEAQGAVDAITALEKLGRAGDLTEKQRQGLNVIRPLVVDLLTARPVTRVFGSCPVGYSATTDGPIYNSLNITSPEGPLSERIVLLTNTSETDPYTGETRSVTQIKDCVPTEVLRAREAAIGEDNPMVRTLAEARKIGQLKERIDSGMDLTDAEKRELTGQLMKRFVDMDKGTRKAVEALLTKES
jgi:hypothetical protein